VLLPASDHIGYLNLWPHARPWRMKHPEPMLRSVPDAAAVARLLVEAWSAATGTDATGSAATTSPEPMQPATAAPRRSPVAHGGTVGALPAH
jgi:hypothetical protein